MVFLIDGTTHMLTRKVLVSSVLVFVFETSGAVDLRGTGAHLIQDFELLLVASEQVAGVHST